MPKAESEIATLLKEKLGEYNGGIELWFSKAEYERRVLTNEITIEEWIKEILKNYA